MVKKYRDWSTISITFKWLNDQKKIDWATISSTNVSRRREPRSDDQG